MYSTGLIGLGNSGLLIPGSQQDIVRQLRILCDGNEIQEMKQNQYFHEVSSWKYAAGVFPKGLLIYSFALDTSKWMKPSGSLNTSRVKNFQIDLDPWPQASGTNYTFDFLIYVESLKVFPALLFIVFSKFHRFANGLAQLEAPHAAGYGVLHHIDGKWNHGARPRPFDRVLLAAHQ